MRPNPRTIAPTQEPTPEDYLALWWCGEVRLPEDALIAWARRQRLLPLLGWRAQQQGWELPLSITEAIRLRRMKVAITQALINRQLKTLGEIAQQFEIPIVLVKGAAAAEAYPEPWMRPYGDIDLLITEDDGARLLAALKRQGYTYAESAEGDRAWHYIPLVPKGPGTRIEIHTALARERGRELFTVEQWRDLLTPSQRYAGLLCPGPTDHVLYLIHHALIHHALQMGMQPFVDIGLWTQPWSAVEWDGLQETAARAEMGNAVGLALALTAWLWRSSKPGGNRFSNPPEALLSQAKAIVSGTATTDRLPHVWRDMPTARQGGIFRYITTIMLGDPAQLRELSFIERLRYHIQRPAQLFHNHGTSLWQLIKGDPASRAAWRAQRELHAWLRGE